MKLLGYFRSLPTGSPNGCQLYSEVKGDVDDTHIALYARDIPDPTKFDRRVVAAANRYGDVIVVSARHHDKLMNAQLKRLKEVGVIETTHTREQGFIDNYGQWMSREEAAIVAREAGQTNQVRLKNTPFKELFSENLY
ncbi:C-N hydrolase superfamily protein [Salmonella phage allotria]|uniref:C-N hydrolase superfamily protein n=1 Tax=Salmonella phage allotria TaxID=2713274 RepID=A0A6G8RM70_9CAUD|nr:C-N hydrolase superfamily protein [Salmonella phage allotria]QIO02486.1 C-N hydrolase superfamily protein [Salmonella phage allotria]